MLGLGANGVFCGVFLICVIILVLVVSLLSRAPFRVVGRILNAMGIWPRSRAKTAVTVSPGEAPALNPLPSFKLHLGVSALSVVTRVFKPHTEIENALNEVDEGFDRGDGKEDGPYDYANNQEAKLSRLGVLFHWISIKPAYMPDTSRMSNDVVEIYLQVAKRFFGSQVSIDADVGSLYEDVDGAITISLFRIRDRNCYYLLNEMRRLINDNVRKLAIMYSSVIALVLVIELFFSDFIDLKMLAGAGIGSDGKFLGMAVSSLDRGISGVVLCLAGTFVMWLTYYMEYIPNQRNNGREMRSFLSRYMSRLSDRYRDSLANARAVTVGDEIDAAKLSSEAQKWHKIVLWLSFRAFFIEGFVRNTLFQIGRNSGYYIIFCPLFLFLGILATVSYAAGVGRIDLWTLFAGPGLIFYLAFAGMFALFASYLSNSLGSIDEMSQTDWLGFDNFNVDRGMDEVVGKYAEDVGYWKGRLDR